MAKVLYTAEAHVEGGRGHGHGRTQDGMLDVDIRAPRETGGEGDGTNPEELFAVGYAACFESALAGVGRRLKLDASDSRIDSTVSLSSGSAGAFHLAVHFDITLPSIGDPEQAVDVVRGAEKSCPYSNATRGNIAHTYVVNGMPLTI